MKLIWARMTQNAGVSNKPAPVFFFFFFNMLSLFQNYFPITTKKIYYGKS